MPPPGSAQGTRRRSRCRPARRRDQDGSVSSSSLDWPGHEARRVPAGRGSSNSIGRDSVLPSMNLDPPFLAAATGRAAHRTPVWFMRQAGRSLPEYRALRGTGSILDAIKQPTLAAEITLQPVRRYGVDAAVLYSDIVVPAHAVGFGVDVAPGTGPVAAEPLRRPSDLERLRPLDEDDITYVAKTVERVTAELGDGVPVLAFAGAPFTVGSYLIEGRPSRSYTHTKALLHTDEVLWHDVMDRLATMAVTFIDVQLRHGA